MKNLYSISTATVVLAVPAFAQDDAAQAMGAALGGIIGLVIVIIIGAIVGWLASLIVKGGSSGLMSDILYGIGGSFLAGWLLPLIGIHLGGVVGSLVAAVVGAVILILIIRAIRKST